MPRYSSKKKRALDALMRDEVYRVAVKILSDESLNRLTMDRLADGVGVSRGTLYNYFEDRDAVLEYVEERTYEPVLEKLNGLAGCDLESAEKLAEMARWIFAAVYEDERLVIALVPGKYARGTWQSRMERRSRAQAAITSVVRQGIEEGTFKRLDSELVSGIFLDAVVGKVEAMVAQGRIGPPEELVRTLLEVVLTGLRVASGSTVGG